MAKSNGGSGGSSSVSGIGKLRARKRGHQVRFTVAGQPSQLSRDQVIRRLKQVRPGRVQTHAVEVDGVTYPVKEALAALTGLDLLDFNTNQARTVFRRLGLRVFRVADDDETQ